MKYIIPFLISIFLVGCMEPKIVYVPRPYYKYKSIPKDLIKDDIVVPKPPKREEFVSSDPIDREVILVKQVVKLYKTISLYKLKLKNINKYEESAKQIYKGK